MKSIFLSVAALMLFCCSSVAATEKVPVIKVAGKVLEVSETFLKIERSLRGDTEVMEFVLEYPLKNIVIGEPVTVSYRQKGTKNILVRVQKAKKTAVRKSGRETVKKVFDRVGPVGASPPQ